VGDGEEQRADVQTDLGKPPDFPGSGASTAIRIQRESFRNTQPGPGKVNMPGSGDVVQVISGGGPPPAPGAGGVLIPAYTAGPDPAEEHAYSYPPGEMPGPAFLEPRIRSTPYSQPRVKINGKQPPSLKDEFFNPPESMDTAASLPAPIVPMEEQNTGTKRAKEEAPKAKAKAKTKPKSKAKKDEIVATHPIDRLRQKIVLRLFLSYSDPGGQN
jgi:hypothetical protein